jgi:hypothetical protein
MGVVVISYSRADQAQVRAIVRLLRGAFRDIDRAVYWDDDFEPGEDWFEQIKQHIDGSPQLFVFWCAHSAGSAQVRRELAYAIDRRKRVVPVLLDGTPMASELAGIHGIDLRDAIVHTTATAHPARASSGSFSSGWRGLSRSGMAIAATVCLAVLSAAAYAIWPRAPQDIPSFRHEVLVTLKPSEVFTPSGDLDPSGRRAIQSAINDVPKRSVEDLRFTVRAANSPAADRAVETIRRYLQSEYQLASDKLDVRRSEAFTADDVRVAVSMRGGFVLASTKLGNEPGSPESVARAVARAGVITLLVEVVFLTYLLTRHRRSKLSAQQLSPAAQTHIVAQFRGYL